MRVLDQRLGDLLAVGALRRQLLEGDPERPEAAGVALEPGEVPVLEDLARGVGLDHPADDLLELLVGDVGHVAALEDLAPVLVDHPALLVHDVVVLEHALADQVVLLLDLLLGVLDRPRQHLRLERVLLALLVDRAEAVEDLVDPLAGEQADQVVLGGEEEARLAGVALAAGAAAQLVVDPPRLVALGAADEQAAGLAHLVALGLRLRLEGARCARPAPSPSSRCSGVTPSFRSSSIASCSGSPPSLMSTPRPAMLVAIVTAPRRPAWATVSPSRWAYSGFAFRTSCWIPARVSSLAEHLRDLDRDRPDEHRLAASRGARLISLTTAFHLPCLVL